MTKKTENNEIRQFITSWDSKYPVDLWYRKKFGIRYGSKEHRELRLIDIRFELEEQRLIEHQEQVDLYKKQQLEKYKDTGSFVEQYSVEEEEDLLDVFDNLDLNSLNT